MNIGRLGYPELETKTYWTSHKRKDCVLTLEESRKGDIFTTYHVLRNSLPQIPLTGISGGLREYKAQVTQQYRNLVKKLNGTVNPEVAARVLADCFVDQNLNEISSGGDNAIRFKKRFHLNPVVPNNNPKCLKDDITNYFLTRKTRKQLMAIYYNTFFPKKSEDKGMPLFD